MLIILWLVPAEARAQNAAPADAVQQAAEDTAGHQAPAEAAGTQHSELSASQLRKGDLLAPQIFRRAVQRVLPSVVTIESYGGLVTRAQRKKIKGISKPGDGPTTGLIISPDGYVLTSTFNFIRRPPIITIVRQDGTRYVGKLLGRDNTRQLCLLKMKDASDLPVPEIADQAVDTGRWAIAVGMGYGDEEPLISAGIISAKNRISGRALQTDANISPANYGGPLLDIRGRVLGICVPLHPKSQQEGAGVEWYDSGIGFAIPLDGLAPIIAAMKAGKTLEAGVLGVQVKPAQPNGTGAEIAKLHPESGAAQAGLQPQDRILQVDGQEVFDVAQLRSLIGRYLAGDEITLLIRRGEDELIKKVTLTQTLKPLPQKKENGKPDPAKKKSAAEPS